jgi:hypothetical protein
LAWTASAGHAQPQPPSQLPSPRLAAVFPAGAKAGTTVDVVISGADLEEAARLISSHPGIRFARVTDRYWRNVNWYVPNTFRITVDASVPVGAHELRAVGKWGVSNPRIFVVGDQAEAVEREPNNDVPQAQRIDMGTTVNGIINPNIDVDYYVFAGRKGQRVVVSCLASSIDSRLEPLLQIRDTSNRLLGSNRGYSGRNAVLDLVLPADGDYTIRVVEHTHLTGGVEHVYRLSVGLTPWIDAVYPPVIPLDKPSTVTLLGRNLPNGQLDPSTAGTNALLDRLTFPVTPPSDPQARLSAAFGQVSFSESAVIDGAHLQVKNAAGVSNPIPVTFAAGPVVLDNDANDNPDKAQPIALPCDLAGRIERRRDRDWYAFTAKANEVFVFEGFAGRLGSPADVLLEIYRVDPKTNARTLAAEGDDQADTTSPLRFPTRTDDPLVRFVAPADGPYLLHVTSRDSDLNAGPRHIYHIAIRKEQPDFRLVVMDRVEYNPSAINLWRGGGDVLEVLCYRRDGFVGEVTLTVEGLPKGVTCVPQVLGPNVRVSTLVFVAAADAPEWLGEIKIKGVATIDGKPAVREARPACMVLPVQQGIPSLSRLTRSVFLSVREQQSPFSLKTDVSELAVPVGGTAVFKVKAEGKAPEVKAAIALVAVSLPTPPNQNPPPQGQNLTPIAAGAAEIEIKLPVPNNIPPGVYNLTVRGSTQIPFNKDPKAPNKPNINVAAFATPVKLTVYNRVADVTLSKPEVDLRSGEQTEVVVKVSRQFGYTAPYRVQVVVPQGFVGVTAADVAIPDKANEVKLVFVSPKGSKPASNPNFVVRVTATLGNVTLTHDAKLAVNLLPPKSWHQLYVK